MNKYAHRPGCACRVCKPTPVADRFWAKVEKTEGCWLWQGAQCGNAVKYGQFYLGNGASDRAHRVSYYLAHGVVPLRHLVIAHTCDNGLCVRPDHLVMTTQAANVRDAQEKGRYRNPRTAANKAKTHCPHGHPYDDENTRYGARGARLCKACDRARHDEEWTQRRRERREAAREVAANEPRT